MRWKLARMCPIPVSHWLWRGLSEHLLSSYFHLMTRSAPFPLRFSETLSKDNHCT